ncbi:MAG: alpha/beta hydrolase [Alphaproteobacteria bacterium]|nr:MAG: alpha/beta hydrolase [Alphaproteobacteria bacterium]
MLTVFQRRFIYPAPPPSVMQPGPMQQVELSTSDGILLAALYRPADQNRPTVIFFHGNGDSLLGAGQATRGLAARGYGLLLVEYRGYGGNSGSPSEAGMYADARAALAFLHRQGLADTAIYAMGNSLGSGPATQLATEQPLAGLILVSGYRSLADVVAEKTRLPIGFLVRDKFENGRKLQAAPIPVLILHGDADRVIPVDHGRTLAVLRQGIAYREFAGVGHELAYLPMSQAATVEWLDRQWQPPAAKPSQ